MRFFFGKLLSLSYELKRLYFPSIFFRPKISRAAPTKIFVSGILSVVVPLELSRQFYEKKAPPIPLYDKLIVQDPESGGSTMALFDRVVAEALQADLECSLPFYPESPGLPSASMIFLFFLYILTFWWAVQ